MNNSINWVGNRVLDSNAVANRPAARTATTTPSSQRRDPSYVVQPAEPAASQPENQAANTPTTFREGPPPSTERGYIPYFLATHIGKNVRAEFIIGTNQYFDKVGIISEVGINYFVLHDVSSGNYVMCDLYSVKFVTILGPQYR